MSQAQSIRLSIPGVAEMLPAEHFSSSAMRTVVPQAQKSALSNLPKPLATFLMSMNFFMRALVVVTLFCALMAIPVLSSMTAFSMVSQSQNIAVIRSQEVPSSVQTQTVATTELIYSAESK